MDEKQIELATAAFNRAIIVATTAAKRDESGKLYTALINQCMGIAADHLVEHFKVRHGMK